MSFLKYLIVFILALSSAKASVSEVQIKGKVISFDASSVKIDQNGQTFSLDRAMVKEKKVVVGKEISVTLTPEQFNQLASKQKELKK